MSELKPEQKIDHYVILERLGAGGLGDVYRARDTREGRTVALKVLPDDFARREALVEAAHVAAALSHPAIAMLFEAGEETAETGRLYLAYEFVAGETLRQALAGGPMHPRRAVPIAIQVADALADAHAATILHRDIKPDNIMVTSKGAAKVLDFGLAPFTGGAAAREAVAAGATIAPAHVASTVAYMSPEQVLAQPVDSRTDIFSLGVVLYEMLTGRSPFAGATADATLMNLLKAQPELPSKLNPQVPPELDAVVMRMLARDMQARYASAAAVSADLRAAFGERTEHILEADREETAAPIVAATPGSRRRAGLLILLVLAAAAAAAYPNRDAVRGWVRHRFGPPPAPVIAVIPLREDGQSSTYFADGLSDDVMMRLGQTPGVTVVGRAAARTFRGRDPADVGRQAGATVVLTGEIHRVNGDLKIDLQLVDSSDGARIWTQQFTNPPNSVVAAQAVIAEEVAKALKVSMPPSAVRERTLARSVAPDAYDTYARARDAVAARQLDRAIALFEQAAKQDEGLAEAYAGLAVALYRRAAAAGAGAVATAQERIREAATRALSIEPDLATAEFASGLAAPTLRESLRHLVRAAALDPSYAASYRAIAELIAPVDSVRAAALTLRARRLDPQAPADRMYDTAAAIELRSGIEASRANMKQIVDAELRALPQ